MRVIILLQMLFLVQLGVAQDSILQDFSGDGRVKITAFGDSLTFGVGDGTSPGDVVSGSSVPFTDGSMGYPARLSRYLGVPVDTEAVPGEVLVASGVFRYPSSLLGTNPDITVIFEGANDARQQVANIDIQRALQRMVNITLASGRQPVLVTLPKPCCEHGFLAPFTAAYSSVIQNTAVINEVVLVDLKRAWETSCENAGECELYNVPEGLHPNTKGYDVIAQTVAGALLGIDVFSSGGASQLASAIGLPVESIVVKPDTRE